MISYRKYKEDASLNTAQSIAARRAFAPSAFRALAYGTGTLPTMIPFILIPSLSPIVIIERNRTQL
jgi:hypothetical protein